MDHHDPLKTRHDCSAVVDTVSNQEHSDSGFKGIAMTVATGFSVLFLVAIPVAIVAISLAMIGCSAARDKYRRHKHLV